MFPIIDKYIDHIDTVQGKALKVPSETRRIILNKVNKIFKLKQKGINLIFPYRFTIDMTHLNLKKY